RRILRSDHAVTKLREHGLGDLAYLVVVLNHEDSFLPTFYFTGGSNDQSVLARHLSREVQLHRGSGTNLTVDFDVPTRLLEEPIDHGKPEARSLVLGLGREE